MAFFYIHIVVSGKIEPKHPEVAIMKRVEIIGTGTSIPPFVVSNAEMVELMGQKNPEWIKRRFGIQERRLRTKIGPEGVPLSDPDEVAMAEEAALNALSRAGLNPGELGIICYVSCTQPPIHRFSSYAMELHRRLGPYDALTFELNSGCGGFLHAIHINEMMLQAQPPGTTSLIVATNNPSQHINRDLYLQTGTWLSVYLFGDLGAAMILRAVEEGWSEKENPYIVASYAGTESVELMAYHAKNGALPVYEMYGKEVAKQFPVLMNRAIKGLMGRYPFSLDEIARFYFHQANLHLVKSFATELGIPECRLSINIDRMGNTSAPSVPAMFDEDLRGGVLKRGDLCLLAAVGAGAHFGAALVRA